MCQGDNLLRQSISPPIQWDFGNCLREMQNGRAAKLQVRPMQSIGVGVFELKDADDKTQYRKVYLARIEDTI
jgi:phage-related protein